MKQLITYLAATFTISVSATAQTEYQKRENAEYKRLSEAAARAFAVNSNNSSSSSSSYRSSNTFQAPSNYSSARQRTSAGDVPMIDFSKLGNTWAIEDKPTQREKQLQAEVSRMSAEYEAKKNKLQTLINQSNLAEHKNNYNAFIQMALQAGFDLYTAQRFFGASANDYMHLAYSKKRKGFEMRSAYTRNYGARGCAGCVDTIYLKDGSGVYYGESQYGLPYGSGALVYKNGDKYFGHFSDGFLEGDIIIEYANGARYVGEYDYKGVNGFGRYIYPSGEYIEGNFVNNMGQGPFKKYGKDYVATGNFTDDDFKGPVLYEYADGRKETRTAGQAGGFTGQYATGGKKWKGVNDYPSLIFTGIYNADGETFKTGEVKYKDGSLTFQGFFGANNASQGYRRDIKPNGDINEAMWENGKQNGPAVYHTQNNAVLTGMINYNGYNLYGEYKAADGTISYRGLKAGQWEMIPDAEILAVKELVKETRKTLANGWAAYQQEMQQMQQ